MILNGWSCLGVHNPPTNTKHPHHNYTNQPDDVDGYGQAPLHLAALRGNLPVVEYLVLDADAETGRKVWMCSLIGWSVDWLD